MDKFIINKYIYVKNKYFSIIYLIDLNAKK